MTQRLYSRLSSLSPVAVLASLLLVVGCGDDLYDSGRCTVTELPSGQAEVVCENGDALLIGDVVADESCRIVEQPDQSRVLRCDASGKDYLVAGPPPTGTSVCEIPGSNPPQTVDCRDLASKTRSCPNGFSGSMRIGEHAEDDRIYRDLFLEYGCKELTGELLIYGDLSEKDLQLVNRVEHLRGGLRLGEFQGEDIVFPNLKTMGGELYLMHMFRLKKVHFPKLTDANVIFVESNEDLTDVQLSELQSINMLRFQSNEGVAELAFPKLRKVYSLEIESMPLLTNSTMFPELEQAEYVYLSDLPALTALTFPALKTLVNSAGSAGEPGANGLNISNLAALTELHLPALETASLHIEQCPALTTAISAPNLRTAALSFVATALPPTLTFAALEEFGGLFVVSLATPVSLSLPVAKQTPDDWFDAFIDIIDNEFALAIHLPMLETIHSGTFVANPGLDTLVLSNLSNVTGNDGLRFIATALEDLDLSKLAGVSEGRVEVRDNPVLTTINLSLVNALSWLRIENNAQLRQVHLANLREVTEIFSIYDNPELNECLVESWVEQLEVYPSDTLISSPNQLCDP